MIELPEAVSIAKQLNKTIKEKRTVEASTGESPINGCFTNLSGKIRESASRNKIREITSVRRSIQIGIGQDKALVVNEFG